MITESKVLVVGCGSIGRRHIKNLRSLGIKHFILCDTSQAMLERAAEGMEGAVLTTDFKEALKENPDAAVICTPSSMHLSMATTLVEKGVHVIIEKPLSHNLEGFDALERLVAEKGVVAMMAMCYRFHPAFLHIKGLLDSKAIGKVYHANYYGGHYLPDWHPNADYRKEYAAQKSLGGGVVLTSIHGLDNVRWLFGDVEEAHAFVDRVSPLEMDVEDLALGIFRMKNGVYVSWQTDFLQRINQHRLVVAGEKGTLRANLVDGSIEVYHIETGKWQSERILFEINTMYVKEMRHFLECIENKVHPCVDLREGYKTLKLALDLKEAGNRMDEDGEVCVTA
ncbi:MAG: Gfo/Idh/MocA family oxidoreductase [Deltaproteobacteria bacterium]|nr:Gfo/Idh/MocA family oxidoreductase [Deltaproteobacteria bacterium]